MPTLDTLEPPERITAPRGLAVHEDEAPRWAADSRSARRDRTGRGMGAPGRGAQWNARGGRGLDMPWCGPTPRVGANLRRLRTVAAGHHGGGIPDRTAVAVDVVPVIRMRATRARWAARWAVGCTLHTLDGMADSWAPTVVLIAGEAGDLAVTRASSSTAGADPVAPATDTLRRAATDALPARGPNPRRDGEHVPP